MRIAYLVNQYPMISTTFIRREILALERQGVEVLRIAMRGWDAKVVDQEDEREQRETRYVLQGGILPILWWVAVAAISSPLRFLAALRLVVKMGWHAERPLPYHFIYLAEACRMLPWLREFGAIHVHTHFGTNAAEVAMLVHALGGPRYSFTTHGPIEFDNPKFLGLGEKVRQAAFVVAITSYARGQLYRWVEQTHWHKIKVVHCGLEQAFYAVPPQPPAAKPRLVCVGRLSAEKGQLLLVEAASRLAAKGLQFELVLVGGGEIRDELDAMVRKLGLTDCVRLTGSISTEQLRDEILQAWALVLASFAEGLPMVIMEAMALRRPILTTDVAGIPELVLPGVNGWLIPAGSIDALADAMETVISTSPDRLREMGEAAYARVTQRHSVDVLATRLAGLFQSTCTATAS